MSACRNVVIVIIVIIKEHSVQGQNTAFNNGRRYVGIGNPYTNGNAGFWNYNNRQFAAYVSGNSVYRRRTPWNPFFQYLNTPASPPQSSPSAWERFVRVYLRTMIISLILTPLQSTTTAPQSDSDETTFGPFTTTPTGATSSVIGKQGWSEWSDWSACSTDRCGIQLRTRQCVKGLCGGLGTEKRNCNYLEPCPLTGTWGSWVATEPCSETCSKGHQASTRTCLHGENLCEGSSTGTQVCNEDSFTFATLCIRVVYASNVLYSQGSGICTDAQLTVVSDIIPHMYDAVIEIMKTTRPEGVKIWVNNQYMGDEAQPGISHNSDAPYFGNDVPSHPGQFLNVFFRTSPNDYGFQVDEDGTARADGFLCRNA